MATSKSTIPRRDVLTGTALAFVAGASGCAKSNPPSAASPASPELLRTQFIADFTAAFIGDPAQLTSGKKDPWPDPNRLWPTPGQKPNDVVADYATFVNVLMTVGYAMQPAPAASSGSLGARIAQFLQTQNWPAGTAVPDAYKLDQPMVHLVEISVILDRLLRAINSFSDGNSGGSGSTWPQH